MDTSKKLMGLTHTELIRAMEAKGHHVFTKDSANYDLNIVGVRSEVRKANRFDDAYFILWYHERQWTQKVWSCTTDPGHHYLQKLLNPAGCAILAPGQYRGVYALDYHQGKYEALCQRLGPVKVYRDGNRDDTLDMDPGTVDFGRFGINHHHRGAGLSAFIQNASAGCQVFYDIQDFQEARSIWRAARDRHGNRFTYTLLEERDF
jgi:hypothetical protein